MWKRFAMALALVALIPAAPVLADVPQSREQINLTFAPLVKKVAPSVVNIYSRKVVQSRAGVSRLFDDPIFRHFFGEEFGRRFSGPTRRKVQNSLGSGVIVRSDGLVVTNAHVIAGADEITVILSDRREFEAEVVGTDERTDLALLRLPMGAEELPVLPFRDSDDLEVGDLVLALGNPFGVGQTVTSGIISGLARTGVGISDLNFFIQTDAAINPGNSGGALVAMDGRLVGINTAIATKSGSSAGVGFATPSNMVRTVIRGLIDGRVVRPWLGARGQPVTQDIAGSMGLRRPVGVLINEIAPGGPADKGGVRVGDVVFAVDDRAVDDDEALKYRIATREPGDTVRLRALRKGREVTLTLKMEPPPEDPPRNVTNIGGRNPFSGLRVANLSPALGEEMGVGFDASGVMVIGIHKRSLAVRYGFKPGDIFVSINSQRVDRVATLARMIKDAPQSWNIRLRRNGQLVTLQIQ